MTRLIDADKLKAHYAWWEGEGEEDRTKRLFDDIIDQQETVDAVRVIRCAGCRYFNERHSRCVILDTDKQKEGFCDEAVRRSK